eukprot:1487125-Prymnesium_polylepis.1
MPVRRRSPAEGSCSAMTHAHAARRKSPEISALRAAVRGVLYLRSYACAREARGHPAGHATPQPALRLATPTLSPPTGIQPPPSANPPASASTPAEATCTCTWLRR